MKYVHSSVVSKDSDAILLAILEHLLRLLDGISKSIWESQAACLETAKWAVRL